MPTYVYRCPAHGTEEVVKRLADHGRVEPCSACGRPMDKVFSALGFIMRPSGYQLKPGDKGYANFDRARELGEVRDPDAGSRLSAGATVSSRLRHEPRRYDDDKMKAFHDAARAVYNAETGKHEW